VAANQRRVLAQLRNRERKQKRRCDRPAPERQGERRDLEVDQPGGDPVAAKRGGGDQEQQVGQGALPREAVLHPLLQKERIIRDGAPLRHSVG